MKNFFIKIIQISRKLVAKLSLFGYKLNRKLLRIHINMEYPKLGTLLCGCSKIKVLKKNKWVEYEVLAIYYNTETCELQNENHYFEITFKDLYNLYLCGVILFKTDED